MCYYSCWVLLPSSTTDRPRYLDTAVLVSPYFTFFEDDSMIWWFDDLMIWPGWWFDDCTICKALGLEIKERRSCLCVGCPEREWLIFWSNYPGHPSPSAPCWTPSSSSSSPSSKTLLTGRIEYQLGRLPAAVAHLQVSPRAFNTTSHKFHINLYRPFSERV